MKMRLVTLAGLALAFGAPAFANANGFRAALQGPASFASVDTRVNNAWADLNAKWISGAITDREYQTLTDALIAASDAAKTVHSDAGTIRYRLQAEIDDLRSRAARSARAQAQLDVVWEKFVEARLRRAMSELRQRATNSPGTPVEYFTAVAEQLAARADAAKSDSDAQNARARFQTIVDALKAKAAASALSAGDFQAFDVELAEEVLVRSAVPLGALIITKGASHQDFARLSDAVRDRAALLGTPSDTLAAYQSAIDRLERAAQAGTVTRDQYNELVRQLGIRARASLQ